MKSIQRYKIQALPSQAYSPCSKRGKNTLYQKVIHCDRREEGNPWEREVSYSSSWRAGASGEDREERRGLSWALKVKLACDWARRSQTFQERKPRARRFCSPEDSGLV